MINKTGNVRIT